MAPPGAGAMALVSIPLVQGKAEEALALFKDHALGIKYTQSQKGALSFDFGIHTAEDGSQTMHIFEYWVEVADYAAYIAKRRDADLMKDWDPVFGVCVAGAPTIQWFPLTASYVN
jgi:quinol monooxygenase YgiN|tara:strand:- start:4586 stop:4930 length:345 start_codon:yes stop_codon:yes gene_type:complete